MEKRAHIDYQKLAENFRRGDLVQKLDIRTGRPMQMLGQVTAVLRGIGFADVEWPHGNERVSVEELIRVNPSESEFLPPMVDTSYNSWDIAKSRLEDETSLQYSYAKPRFAAELAVAYQRKINNLQMEANRCFAAGMNELQAYSKISSQWIDRLSDFEVRDAVRQVFALYWHGTGRIYRRSREELQSKKTLCPKCKNGMKRRAYTSGGRIMTCTKCGFAIRDEDIV